MCLISVSDKNKITILKSIKEAIKIAEMGDTDTFMNFKDEPQEGQEIGTEVLSKQIV